MFKTRLISGIILVIVLIATVGTGGNVLFGLLAVVSLIGLTELYKVIEVQNKLLGFAGYLAPPHRYQQGCSNQCKKYGCCSNV